MNKRVILFLLAGWLIAAFINPRDLLARFTK